MADVHLDVAKYGMGMTEATLVEWLVELGEHVEAGQPCAQIETDKVDMTVDAPVAGTLVEQTVPAGQDFEVPGRIGRLRSDDD